MTAQPSVVVFDIGNVLIEWDPKHLYRHLFPDRPEAMAWFLDTICTPAWNLEQDAGRTWAEGVGLLVERYPEWRAEIEAYDRRWHTMIPRAIDGSVAILEALKAAGRPVYAITNFSAEKYRESFARFPFFALFDGVIVSADEQLLKPHAPIFELLCSRYGLEPGQCFFIDDNADNVEGARTAGMTALRFTEADSLQQALRSAGLLPTTPVKPPDPLASRLACAEAAAREAGRLLGALYQNRGTLAVESKGLNDFVSRADREAEQVIRAAIASSFPEDGFVGEETGHAGLDTAAITWVVDPLDGTTNFLKGVPFWCVSIGLLIEGRVAGGVIYDPLRDELFSATCERADLNGVPIAVGRESDPGRAIVGLGYTPRVGPDRFAADTAALVATGLNCRLPGAGALTLAYVAAGRIDAYHERHMWPWDAVAGLALIEGAGGTHIHYPPGPDLLAGGPVLAANPPLYATLQAALAEPPRV